MSGLEVLKEQSLDELSDDEKFNFYDKIQEHNCNLDPVSVETLQVNITKLCNQACLHCHVDSSPKRTESMNKETVDACLEVLRKNDGVKKLDITGGAPELNPYFDYMVEEAVKLGKHVMVRHNLTVTVDGNPNTKESKRYIPEFYAAQGVEVISSLPYYEEYFTDKQRGRGVFEKSIEALKLLNEQGYGKDDSGLILNLVYNPVGAFLPATQESLSEKFKSALLEKFGIVFNDLFVVTNMPIHRFKTQLKHLDQHDDYMTKLINAFNPDAAKGVMCRSMISVSYDGKLFDCDFNQMLNMQVPSHKPMTIFDFDHDTLINRQIMFAHHCFGCTAGAGSSCTGETA